MAAMRTLINRVDQTRLFVAQGCCNKYLARHDSTHAVKYLQHRCCLCIRHAVEALRAEAHLEGGNHMTCGDIQHAGLLDLIAKPCQLLLVPANAWRVDAEVGLLPCHGVSIRPDTQPGIGQALPREQWPRVQLAQRGDVTVADDMAWFDVVAFDNVLEQRDQRLDLRLAVRVPDPAVRGVGKARVDDLDTNGRGVQPGAPLPCLLYTSPSPRD